MASAFPQMEQVTRCDPESSLRVISAEDGSNAPQDILASLEFAELLKSASHSYDCIVVDTPPAGAFSDAALVARASTGATGTIMVVRGNRTPIEAAQATVRGLMSEGMGMPAAVLNDVDFRKSPRFLPYTVAQYSSARAYIRA